jgi:hypothetical protein
MKADESNITRRDAVVLGTRWLFAGSVIAVVVAPPRAHAGKASKADFFYQEKPKDGKSCANCRLFVASESGKGTCAVVDGDVSPNGWCMAYSPRG